MGSVNKVFLVGNLGRDAEQRHTTSGSAVSNLNLATTDTWTDKASGQRQERTEWHRVVVWGRQAESLQPYLTKGKQICVEGRLQTREWNDRDGNKRSTTEVVADRITLLGGRGGAEGGGRGMGGGRDMAGDRGQDMSTGGGDYGGGDRGQDMSTGGRDHGGGDRGPDMSASGGGDSGPANLNEDDIPF